MKKDNIEGRCFEMTEEDFSRVRQIWSAGTKEAHSFITEEWSEYWSNAKGNFEKELINLLNERYVWKIDGEVVGFMLAQRRRNNHAYIFELYVDKDRRRGGIGTKLIKELKKRYSSLAWHVYEQNTFIEFHKSKKLGFKIHKKTLCKYTRFPKLYMEWTEGEKD